MRGTSERAVQPVSARRRRRGCDSEQVSSAQPSSTSCSSHTHLHGTTRHHDLELQLRTNFQADSQRVEGHGRCGGSYQAATSTRCPSATIGCGHGLSITRTSKYVAEQALLEVSYAYAASTSRQARWVWTKLEYRSGYMSHQSALDRGHHIQEGRRRPVLRQMFAAAKLPCAAMLQCAMCQCDVYLCSATFQRSAALHSTARCSG